MIRARMCEDLPTAIEVRLGDRAHPVVPVADLEIDDPRKAALLAHYRRRRTAAGSTGDGD